MTAQILSAFLPVFAMIAAGYAVRVSGWLPMGVWSGVNALNYRLLLPCFLFAAIAGAGFEAESGANGLLRLALISGAASLALAAIAFAGARLARIEAAAAAPLIATAGLWNLVMFMALSARLLGEDVHAAAAAILGPGAVAGAAVTVAAFSLSQSKRGFDAGAAVRLVRDPLVIGAALGLAFNLTGLSRAPFMLDTVTLMGAGATAAILISMGAGLEFSKLKGRTRLVAAAAGLRALAAPAVFLGLGLAFALPAEHVVLLTLAGGAPGAAIIYAIGSEFDADRPLTAGMLTGSVLASAIALPLFTALALSLTGAAP